jgi:hypothetical protein
MHSSLCRAARENEQSRQVYNENGREREMYKMLFKAITSTTLAILFMRLCNRRGVQRQCECVCVNQETQTAQNNERAHTAKNMAKLKSETAAAAAQNE